MPRPPVPCLPRPTWAEVDLGVVAGNYRTLQGLLTPTPRDSGWTAEGRPATRNPRLIPVIKANAYGHGAIPVARALAAAGAAAFAVALVEEGIELRESGVAEEVLVLQGAWPGQEEDLVHYDLTATVYSAAGLHRLDKAAGSRDRRVRIHIKVDTGMARLGVAWDRLGPVLGALRDCRCLRLAGAYSHLATAEETDRGYADEQMRRFRQALRTIRDEGFDAGEIHLANSAGLLYEPDLRELSARPGIALYGYPPAPERCPVPLRPALCLKTRIGRIHRVAEGESVGYNRRFVAKRPTIAATLPIGYADGYRRDLTGKARVIIGDRFADVIGAVSMDMIVADVTDIPEAREEAEVILLGASANCRFDASDWADSLGTIPYEILCGIGPRVPRIYAGADGCPPVPG